jgi:hypothetical protein
LRAPRPVVVSITRSGETLARARFVAALHRAHQGPNEGHETVISARDAPPRGSIE